MTVLTLVAQGLTGTAIGRRLGISPRTVTKHQEKLYRKLQVSDRVTAVLRAQSWGLLPVNEELRPASPESPDSSARRPLPVDEDLRR
ncbi:LuxR C-terminal-related transcriptional regulator [Acrocarpospora macrocephala]|uniref:LuxR C-terminal-related transcriptional regulator n=1 Tax=Acrocarpospora macrocephala TaxID=150177 RepID=UPI0024838567